MANLRKWSQTATGNASVAGGVNTINFAEGQNPGSVNNSAREMMAQIRGQYTPSNWGWVEHSATASVASQTSFKVSGNQTSDYTAGRRWRLKSGSTTRYGSVVSSSFTVETTVTVTVDSGSLSTSHSLAALSVIDSNHVPTSYLTSASLTTALGSYVTSASLDTALATYVTSSSLATAVANYVTSNSASAMIAAQITAAPKGLTLISTLTTTSGTTQSVTSISSSYRALYIELDGVSFNASSRTLTLGLSDNNGSSYSGPSNISSTLTNATDKAVGVVWVYNIQNTSAVTIITPAVDGPGGTIYTTMARQGVGPVNAIQFAGGTFDAGTIRVYGFA